MQGPKDLSHRLYAAVLIDMACTYGSKQLDLIQVILGCRFTLDELEGFLEKAKDCIPGVKEAIGAANSHKAHQVHNVAFL